MAPVNVIVYAPGTEAGKESLAKRVAEVHAAAVNQHLTALNCPASQKQALLTAILNTIKQRSREQDR